jgi:Domain of unknown function (DUF4382)
MHPPSRSFESSLIRRGVFCGLAIPLIFMAGCNNTCFVGVVNAPNSGLLVAGGSPPPACSLNQTMAAVQVTANLAPVCADCSASQQVSHVQLAISGIELHAAAVADENSPEWQELAPELAQQPRIVDLAANSTANQLDAMLKVTGKIPAGTYYQLRVRLADASSLNVEQFSAIHSCGSTRGGCVVNADGALHSLQTLDGQPYLRVEIESPFGVRPGQINQLHLEFNVDWAIRKSAGGVIEMAPLLRSRVARETLSSAGSI